MKAKKLRDRVEEAGDRYNELIDLVETLAKARGTEILRLRATIAQHFRAAIDCITFTQYQERTNVRLRTNTHNKAELVFIGGRFHKFFVTLAGENDLIEIDPILASRN